MKRLLLFLLIGILYTITLVAATSCSFATTCPTYSGSRGPSYNARAESMKRKQYFYTPQSLKK